MLRRTFGALSQQARFLKVPVAPIAKKNARVPPGSPCM